MCRQKRQELQQSPEHTSTECPHSLMDLSSGKSTLKHAPPTLGFVFPLHHSSRGTERVMACHFDASLNSNGRN